MASQADELRAEISAKQAELQRVDERLMLVRRLMEIEAGGLAISGPTSRSPTAQPVNGPESVPAELEAAVEQILREAGEPLHISSIRQILLDRRVPIPGRGDDANIIVRLRRLNQQFMRTARGTYGLTEWGLPALSGKAHKRRRRAVSK